MEKDILANQALQAHMLFFDPPDKLLQLKNPFPKVIPADRKLDDLLQMEFTEIEPAVKVYENGGVRFLFHAPEAETVEVSGLDDGFPPGRHAMAKGDDGWWSLILSGISPGFHYYEFFSNGNRLVNPNAQCGYNRFQVRNFFDLPSDEDDYWMLKDVPHGDVRMEYYKSAATGKMKRVWVYTPPEYDSETCRYPALYVQHGEGENETGWIWQGRLNLIADNLIAAGKCGKVVIVMNAEYKDFDAELRGSCITYINAKFRTLADQHHTMAVNENHGACNTWDQWRLSLHETLTRLFPEVNRS